METELQDITEQAVSHRHASGEIYEAHDIESAYVQCTGLAGKISLEEFGLLLELETIGKEEMAKDTPEQTQKPAVNQVEKQSLAVEENTDISVSPTPDTTHEETHAPVTNSEALERVNLTEVRLLVKEQEAEVTSDDTGSEQTLAKPIDTTATETQNNLHSTLDVSEPTTVNLDTPAVLEVFSDKPVLQQHSPETAREEISDSVGTTINDFELPVPFAGGTMDLADDTNSGEDKVLHDYEFTDAEYDTKVSGLTEFSLETNNETDVFSTDETVVFMDDEYPERLHVAIEDVGMHPFVALELPAPIDEVETALTSLIEVFESKNEAQTEVVREFFQEIQLLSAESENHNKAEEAQLEQKIETLFAKLFTALEINYSTELLTSLARLTRKHYLDNIIDLAQQAEDEAPGLPDDVGTREFFQQLQHTLVVVQQTTVRFYELGKSALKLYRHSQLLAVS